MNKLFQFTLHSLFAIILLLTACKKVSRERSAERCSLLINKIRELRSSQSGDVSLKSILREAQVGMLVKGSFKVSAISGPGYFDSNYTYDQAFAVTLLDYACVDGYVTITLGAPSGASQIAIEKVLLDEKGAADITVTNFDCLIIAK
jgi:hypothetical protein